jgi:hypothetical protein
MSWTVAAASTIGHWVCRTGISVHSTKRKSLRLSDLLYCIGSHINY